MKLSQHFSYRQNLNFKMLKKQDSIIKGVNKHFEGENNQTEPDKSEATSFVNNTKLTAHYSLFKIIYVFGRLNANEAESDHKHICDPSVSAGSLK